MAPEEVGQALSESALFGFKEVEQTPRRSMGSPIAQWAGSKCRQTFISPKVFFCPRARGEKASSCAGELPSLTHQGSFNHIKQKAKQAELIVLVDHVAIGWALPEDLCAPMRPTSLPRCLFDLHIFHSIVLGVGFHHVHSIHHSYILTHLPKKVCLSISS